MSPRILQPLPRVRLIAPLEASGSGAEAFLGLASDGRQYWVKAPDNPQGARTLVAEVIGYGIGRLIGAPVPPNALIEIPEDLGWAYANGRQMASGVGHASLNVPDVVVVEEWGIHSNRDGNLRRQAFILAMWDLCLGGDAHWIHQVTEDFKIWTIDHGFWLAGEVDWDLASLRKRGVRPWPYDLDPGAASASALKEAADNVADLELEMIQGILKEIPLDWNTTQEEISELAYLLFIRVEGVANRLRDAAQHSRYP